jgi:hypothetical protein
MTVHASGYGPGWCSIGECEAAQYAGGVPELLKILLLNILRLL